MQALSGNESINFGSRLTELGIVLPASPTPLGAYVESSDTRNLLFLSGTLPVVNGKLAIAGRLGENLSVKEGQDAARIASLNALAAAKKHLGDINRLKKLVKLTVVMATTEQFVEHAAVADGASNLFAQLFGRDTGHVRLVYGVQSLPIGTPVIVDTIFEIEPVGPLSPQNAKMTDRNYPKARRGAALALRLALAAGFLSAVADRLGLWGKPGTPGVAWGDWSNFISYTAKLNWFLPHQFIQPVGALATLLEIILATGLLAGFWRRRFALVSCGLLLLFALSMTVAIGIKPPLDYSVYTAAAGAALLGTVLCDRKIPNPKLP